MPEQKNWDEVFERSERDTVETDGVIPGLRYEDGMYKMVYYVRDHTEWWLQLEEVRERESKLDK